jgi:hypothetical protein
MWGVRPEEWCVAQKEDGNYYSLDNRRLAAFKLLDINVPVKIVQYNDATMGSKFTSVTNGLSIIVRGTGITIK